MPNFVDDETPLDYPKAAVRATAASAVGYTLRAEDWNRLCQATVDVRGAIISLRALTQSFAGSAAGLVPVSDGVDVSTLFLRKDGAWAEPPGGGASTYPLPEQWTALAVPVSATNETMSAQVATGDDAVAVIRSGNITGLVVKLSEAPTDGTVTIAVTINGAVGGADLRSVLMAACKCRL